MTNIHPIDYLKNNGLPSQDDMAKHEWHKIHVVLHDNMFFHVLYSRCKEQ
jgi:hypothetical protein